MCSESVRATQQRFMIQVLCVSRCLCNDLHTNNSTQFLQVFVHLFAVFNVATPSTDHVKLTLMDGAVQSSTLRGS